MRTRFNVCIAIALITVATTRASSQHIATNPAIEDDVDDLTDASAPIIDLAIIAVSADLRLVGREVSVRNARIDRISDRGFWVSAEGARDHVFVVPAEGPLITVQTGETVSFHGEVRRLPRPMRNDLHTFRAWNEPIYIYAYTVRPAWPVPPHRESSIGY